MATLTSLSIQSMCALPAKCVRLPDGETRRGLDGSQTHPRHQHAGPRRAWESLHRKHAHCPQALSVRCSAQRLTDGCRPLQVNRIKVPKQLDELVEMPNESANPVVKVLCKIRAQLRGVRSFFFFLLDLVRFEPLGCEWCQLFYLFFALEDLVDFYEMLQLPSERKHNEAGSSLVHFVIWVRNNLLLFSFYSLCVFMALIMFNGAIYGSGVDT